MHFTKFAGLVELDPSDPITVDGSAFTQDNPSRTDYFLRIGAVTHKHDAHSAIPNPAGVASAVANNSGGQIGAGLDVSLAYTLVDSYGGETTMSTPVVVSTPSSPNAPSAAISAAFDPSGGSLPVGQYSYALTMNDSGGNESALGPSVFVTRSPGYASGQIQLSGLSQEIGATYASWNLWRAQDGGNYQVIATQQTGDTFTDTGLVCTDAARTPPVDNSAINSFCSITVTIPDDAQDPSLVQAVQANFYLSLDGSFSNPSFYLAVPTASAGDTFTITTLTVSEGQPPAVSLASVGANQIDPDTDLLDWHWKRPVSTYGALPSGQQGDVRLALDSGHPYAVLGLDAAGPGDWTDILSLVPGGGGGAGVDQTASAANGSAMSYGEIVFMGSGATTVSVTNLGAGSALVTVTTPPSSGGSGGVGPAGPQGVPGVNATVSVAGSADSGRIQPISEIEFAGSGGTGVAVKNLGGGSALVLISASGSTGGGDVGPAGPIGPAGSSAVFTASAGNASAIVGPFLGFAGSGGTSVDLLSNGGSAIILISAPGARAGDATPVLHRRTASPGAQTGGFATSLLQTVVAGGGSSFNCYGWVCTTRTGRVAMTWRQGTGDNTEDGKIMLATADDGGTSFTTTAIFTPAASHDFRDPCITCTSTGRLLVSFFDSVSGGATTWGWYVAYSDDNGATWTQGSAMTPFSSWTAESGAILAHSSGVLIAPIYGENTSDTSYRAAVMLSYDDGLTWTGPNYVTAQNSNTGEMTLVELANGNVLALIRVNGVTNGTAIETSLSTDGGQTWSSASSIGFSSYSCRPTGIMIPASQMLVLFYRQATTAYLAYRVSTNNGGTWGSEQVWTSAIGNYAGGIASDQDEFVLATFFDNGGGSTAQFSVNSTGRLTPAGTVLATHSYAQGTDTDTTSTSTTFSDVDATNQAVTFIAPPTGNVIVEVSGVFAASNYSNNVYLCLRNGTTNIGSVAINQPTSSSQIASTVKFLVTGLTPGASTTLKLGFRTSNSATNVEVWSGPTFGPVVYEVRAN